MRTAPFRSTSICFRSLKQALRGTPETTKHSGGAIDTTLFHRLRTTPAPDASLQGLIPKRLGSEWRWYSSAVLQPQHLFQSRHAGTSGRETFVRFYVRQSSIDIGKRARELQIKRMWTLALSGTAVAGLVIVVLNSFSENLMFYITPTQALEKFAADPSKNRFRLGGLVLEGSVKHFGGSTEMEFVVTDLANEILVKYRGAVPDLFREGHSVVAEGYLKPRQVNASEGEVETLPGGTSPQPLAPGQLYKTLPCYFAASEVLAKHDEKYMPKEVAEAVARNKAAIDDMNKLPDSDQAPSVNPLLPPIPARLPAATRPSKLSKVAQAPTTAEQYDIAD